MEHKLTAKVIKQNVINKLGLSSILSEIISDQSFDIKD